MVFTSGMKLFSKVMVCYWGFFGVTLLVYPNLHSVDGVIPNPYAFWTKLSPTAEFVFRIFGMAVTGQVLAPKLFEMRPSGFVKMMLWNNVAFFLIAMYYSLYEPLGNQVLWVWKTTLALSGVLIAWNMHEVFDATSLLKYYARFVVFFFGSFALSLITTPDLFWGPPSPVAYWKKWGPVALLPARSFGYTMGVLLPVGYNVHDLAKFCTLANGTMSAFLLLFALPAFFSSPRSSAITWIWQVQFFVQLPIGLVGAGLRLRGALGSLRANCACALPACDGANAATFNLVQVVFYLPFVAAFLIDPNLFLGPQAPLGMPMFVTELNECAIWFGRAWATVTFLLAVSPYFAGVSHGQVVKQWLLCYACSLSLFIYNMVAFDFFNLTLVAPLTGVSAIFLIWCAIIVYNDSQATKEPFLYMA